ncbi:MAG: phosphotransferase [Deltaproteobacteria bacterium]
MDERVVSEALATVFRPPARPRSIEELAGDASTRRYFRIRLSPGAPVPSLVVMEYPDPVPPGEELPFVHVHRYLHRAGIPVPEIYGHFPGTRLLLLEDGGDLLLERAVRESAEESDYLPLYERSVEILVRIQHDGTRALDFSAIPSRLAFDVNKFAEEIDFFFEHAVREYGGIPLSDAEERAIEDLFLPVLTTLARLPRVLAHRDYHSRNILVRPADGGPASLRILDFQDARMGTLFYDLASLLRDSYVTLPEPAVDHLAYVYRHAAPGELRRMGGDPGAFAAHLDLAALQRNVKAIGTFGNQAANRGKRFYLRFIPPTVDHIEANIARNPRLRPLGRRLLPILSDLAGKAREEAPP